MDKVDFSPAKSQEEIFRDINQTIASCLRCDYGISYLDDALLGLFPGEVTLMGARSGFGKTEAATQILLAQEKKARSVLYFALDHEQGEIETRILWRNLILQLRSERAFPNKRFRYSSWRAGEYGEMLKPYEGHADLRWKQICSSSESMFVYGRRKFDGKDLCDSVRALINFDTPNLIIIDHFHALVFHGDRFREEAKAMAEIVTLSQEIDRPILVMGQFRKRSPGNRAPIPDMEEFSGSSDLIYLPQNIIVFSPDHRDGADFGSTYFHVEKARIASDSKAFVGIHGFDIEAKSYSDRYAIGRFKPFSEPEMLAPGMYPHWAGHAQRPSVFESVKTERSDWNG